MKPRLDRWILHGNCLVGFAFDSNTFSPGTRIMTEAVRFIDLSNSEAECLDGKYKLGEPGSKKEHEVDYFVKREPEKIKINESIFLNPRG